MVGGAGGGAVDGAGGGGRHEVRVRRQQSRGGQAGGVTVDIVCKFLPYN